MTPKKYNLYVAPLVIFGGIYTGNPILIVLGLVNLMIGVKL